MKLKEVEFATNAELEKEKEILENQFDTLKKEWNEKFEKMNEIAEVFAKIEETLNKRKGVAQ